MLRRVLKRAFNIRERNSNNIEVNSEILLILTAILSEAVETPYDLMSF